MLWLALCFPLLPLEALTRGDDVRQPAAVELGRRLWRVNAAAREFGVQPDMSINAALALAPDLRVRVRNEVYERRALEEIAGWVLQFSPQISLISGQGLLLEIGASLRLFGGLDALLSLIRSGLPELGFSFQDAVLPTPTAAWMAARLGVSLRVCASAGLVSALGPLDVGSLGVSAKMELRLRGMGLHRIEQLLKLPRKGLAKRLGADVLARLDRAVGRLPDPRPHWQPPAHFDNSIDLPVEAEGGASLRFALHRLVLALSGFLRGSDAGAGRLELLFHHREQGPTPLILNLMTPGRDVTHLEGLIMTRLDRLPLPAPVTAIRLICDDVRRFETASEDLFGLRRKADEAVPELIERLRARLGDAQVHGLCALEDHRPEQAWARHSSSVSPSHVRRPLWLLRQPRPIETRRLYRVSGPERIETGWWDGHEVARDYFVAQTRDGRRLWIYRSRSDLGIWYLHGLFA
ncbi:MAG: DNA polymerase Y family protein [Gammaproteobacteria bacterium]|nr:DNA polymerase Y family protein [Gammaproteobacteria bacterium]MCP5136088.1 DNA polymerase Y family protein [Gammaproteobacteria bacterium]